ncbi:hypothetical protein F5X97DRAFT_346870 [Nemania serpens]|nr:hypothetical protein F5X97DRAFT_346870 [Nemania serpens]
MEFFRNIIDNGLWLIYGRQAAGPRARYTRTDYLHDLVDRLLWTAVRYADGPMRPYMEQDPMFAKFCNRIDSFKSLFKVDRRTRADGRPSHGIPDFIRNYLHQQLERDLEWLDVQFCNDESCPLVYALLHGILELESFEVGVVISLVTYLLQLVLLYGPGDDFGSDQDPEKARREAAEDEKARCHALELVMRCVGNEPRFLWVQTGETKRCYFAVSHKHSGSASMDRGWPSPRHDPGSTSHVDIGPAYQETAGDSDTRTDDDGHPEQLLCVFRDEAAASSVLNPKRGSS